MVSQEITDLLFLGSTCLLYTSMVVMAETALPEDAKDYINDPRAGLSSGEDGEKKALERFLKEGRRVRGQTPDQLLSLIHI